MNGSLRFKYLLLFALFLGFLEASVFWSNLTMFNKLIFHLLISVICLIAVLSLISLKKREDLRFIMLLTILIGFMGPLGAFLGILTIMLFFYYRRDAKNIKDLLLSIFPEHQISLSYYYYDRIIHGLDDFNSQTGTCEFMDIMSFGTSKQKRLALEKITRHFNPQFASSLFLGLKDEDNQIRVLAATSITTLDQILFKRYLKLEKKYLRNDVIKMDILKFALHCDRYYSSKLLDEERRDKVLRHAIDAYEKYFSVEPGHAGVWSALLKLYILSKQPEKAVLLYEAYAGKRDIPIKIKILYLNALYVNGGFLKIRQFISKNSELLSIDKNREFIKIAHLWSVSV